MEATRTQLADGMYLTYLPAEKFKTSLLSAQFVTPLRRETAAAYALLPAVLRRGTVSCPDMGALSARLDKLYGAHINYTVRKKGENQCVGFVASFLDDAFAPGGEPILEPAAGLLGELLLRPRLQDGIFAEEYVSGERANLVDRIRGQINDKRSYATLRLGQLMCGEEAFGVDKLGDVEHAAAVTPGSLWERYQQLLSTAQIELYYCGSAEEERVARALKEALSALPVNEGRICPDCEVRLHAGPEPSMVEESMDVTQGKLAMGFRTGGVTCWEEEYPAMAMCNAVFGGTTLSKLFMNVREKLSLCYYASSTLEKMKGLILVSSGIEFDKFQQARDEILHQLEEIRQGNMEDWEREGTRRTMIGAHLATLDVQDRQEDFWLGQTAAGLETGIEELVAQLEQVTREQVAQAAQKLELDTIYFLKGTEG
mgnify:CR=1 FL=1